MKHALKRVLDVTGALVGIALLSPIMLLVAVGVHLTMGSPVLFRQQRPGLNQQPFDIYKFRSMRSTAGLSDAQRLTPFGNFIRKTSLDELPQLFNILEGTMSFVGPRPLLFEYIPYYTATEMRRHEVKPGVTGWAQIHGRNNLNWDDRLAKDIWYVDHWSPLLDIKIILKTIGIVLTGKDVTTEGHATYLRLDEYRHAKGQP
jgi:lipopolysaccharide/colanic/teichoic acid biosynthesis glycosyltransferase